MAVATPVTTPLSKPAHADTSYARTAHEAGHETYAERLRLNRLGMWLFFISEAFLFGALLVDTLLPVGQHPARSWIRSSG